MGKVVDLNFKYYATCACGSQEFLLPVDTSDGVTDQWQHLQGTECVECGMVTPWVKITKQDEQ